jgi:hypothetical protein
MPVNVVMLAEFELEIVVVAAMTLVSKSLRLLRLHQRLPHCNLTSFFFHFFSIMPVHVVVLAEFELEVAVVALVLKPPSQGFEYLEAVEAAPEAALSEVVVA